MSQTSNRQWNKWIVEALPAIVASLLALIAFMAVGHTPAARAIGMAMTIGAMTLMLRDFGSGLSIAGGLGLAFSSAFWAQTGGLELANAALFGLVLLAGATGFILVVLSGRLSERVALAGILIMALLVLLTIGAPRSLRVTTLLSSGLMLLLITLLMGAHPHPYRPSTTKPSIRVVSVIIIIFIFGILNDPLFILLAPATILGITTSGIKLSTWHWGIIVIMLVIGIRGVIVQYLDTGWWLYPAGQAEALGLRVPYVMADGWRHASRWLYLIDLLRNQFTEIGILLGILGLSRLSRWYPPVGIVTLVAFASYVLFGLVYFGKDSTTLLLPMFMILVVWMTYAIFALGQWIQKTMPPNVATKWLATAVFMLVPLLLFIRIAGLYSV